MAKETAKVFDSFQDENSINLIASKLPRKLLSNFGNKNFYSPKEVDSVFSESFTNNSNIHFAYVMFCSAEDFSIFANEAGIKETYSELRTVVSEKCFDGWPRFNFESLLSLSHESPMSELVREVTDISLDIFNGG